MKTNYKINKNELILNLNVKNLNLLNLRINVNIFLLNNNINFKGNKIIIYNNTLLIGTFYLINYYLKILNINKNNYILTKLNSLFYENYYLELSNKKIIVKRILDLY